MLQVLLISAPRTLINNYSVYDTFLATCTYLGQVESDKLPGDMLAWIHPCKPNPWNMVDFRGP